ADALYPGAAALGTADGGGEPRAGAAGGHSRQRAGSAAPAARLRLRPPLPPCGDGLRRRRADARRGGVRSPGSLPPLADVCSGGEPAMTAIAVAAAPPAPLVEVEGLRKWFHLGGGLLRRHAVLRAVDDVSFSI